MVNYRNLEEFSLAVAELQQEEEVGIENEAIATKSDVAAYIRCKLDFSRAVWEISDDVWKQFVFTMNLTTTQSTRKFVRRLNPERSRINLDVALKRIVYDPACADFVREHKYSVLKWLEELWQKGGLPKCWKECKLMPIRKETADEDDSDAYAPVLIPNYMYRLWDGVLVFKLDNEIKKHRILSKGQSHYGSGVTVKELIFMLEYFIRRKISEENGELYVLFAKIKSFKKDHLKIQTGGMVNMQGLKSGKLRQVDDAYDTGIGTQFSVETNKRDEDEEMMKYIEEQLARRKGNRSDDDSQSGDDVGTLKYCSPEEAALRAVPAHLRQSSTQRSEEMLSNQMLSGIPEVDLGIEAKIRNIEATEEAKLNLLRENLNKKDGPSQFVPSNMAVNFIQHNRFNVDVEVPKKKGKLDVPDSKRKEKKEDKATDDYHYEKFKKQFRKH